MTLLQTKNDLFLQLQSEHDTLAEHEEKIVTLVEQKAEYENQIKEYEERLNEEELNGENLEAAKRRVSATIHSTRTSIINLSCVPANIAPM